MNWNMTNTYLTYIKSIWYGPKMVQHLIMIDLVYTDPIDHIKTSIKIGQNWVKVSMILDQNKFKNLLLVKVFQIFLIIWLHPFGGLHKFQFGIEQKTNYEMWSCFTCSSSDNHCHWNLVIIFINMDSIIIKKDEMYFRS
jgi:hypothetical protein